METKKITSSQKIPPQKPSFQDWQEKIAQKINDVLFCEPSDTFQNDQEENFMGLEIGENNYESRTDIENNLVYNLPNLACFLYQTFPNESDELILSILQAYQKQSGLNFLGINWKNKTDIPEKFKIYTQNHPLDEKYILYLLGKPFTFKRYLGAKESEQKEELLKKYNQKIKSLFTHPLFRKKLEEKIDMLLHINETEILRKYVNASFEKLSELRSISDRDWINFLVEEAKKDKKELENALKRKKRKLKTTTQKADKSVLEDDIEIISQELEKIKNDLLLAHIPKDELSTETFPIISPEEIQGFKKELDKKRLLNDNLGIGHLEEEIIHNIMKHLSRYFIEKGDNDKENAIPKNFFENKSLTCFSGVWSFAAMLIKAGFSQENIFIVNSFVGGNQYNHAFLVIRKNDGSFLKVDYGLKEIVPITPTKEVEKSLMFLLNLGYTAAGYSKNNKIEGLDTKGRLYKLTDGIMLMYLMNLAHSLIEKNKLDEAYQYLNIVAGIDDKNYDLNEALGVYFEKKGEKQKAFEYFRMSGTLISQYYMSVYYFDTKEYKKAEGGFDYFITSARDARGIDKKLLTSAVQFLAKIRKKNKQGKIEGIGIGMEKQRHFLIELYNHYIHRELDEYEKKKHEYITLDETDRKRILHMLSNYAKGFKHTQPAEIIMDLVRKERLADTQLYKRLNMGEFQLNV